MSHIWGVYSKLYDNSYRSVEKSFPIIKNVNTSDFSASVSHCMLKLMAKKIE